VVIFAAVQQLAGPGIALRTVGEVRRFDRHPVAWYVVPLLVLLALGLTVYLGALAFCMLRGMHLVTVVELGSNGRFLIGCE